MTRTDRQEQRVPRETSQQKARRVIRKGRPKCEVDGAKDRKQELALTVALSTELDVRGKGWKQRAVLKCSPSLWPFETTALQTPIILKSPRFSSPLSAPFPFSISALAQAPVPALSSLWIPQFYPYPVSRRGTGRQGRRGTGPWQEGTAQQSGRVRTCTRTPSQTHLPKTGRNQQTNKPRERIWGVESERLARLMRQPYVPTPEALSLLPMLALGVFCFLPVC